jgi:hypothetical protein
MNEVAPTRTFPNCRSAEAGVSFWVNSDDHALGIVVLNVVGAYLGALRAKASRDTLDRTDQAGKRPVPTCGTVLMEEVPPDLNCQN